MKDLIDILATPTAVFKRLKENPGFWAPLLLLLVMLVATTSAYMLLNDDRFVRDQMVAQVTGFIKLNKEQMAQIEKRIDNVSLTSQAVQSSVSICIIIPVVLSLYALYLSLMAKFTTAQLSYKHWFSLASWTTVPNFFAYFASLLVLVTDTNHQVSQSDMQVLGVVHLLNLDLHSQTLESFNLMSIWGLVLGVIGYRQWTGTSWLHAAMVSMAPSVLIYGIVLSNAL